MVAVALGIGGYTDLISNWRSSFLLESLLAAFLEFHFPLIKVEQPKRVIEYQTKPDNYKQNNEADYSDHNV